MAFNPAAFAGGLGARGAFQAAPLPTNLADDVVTDGVATDEQDTAVFDMITQILAETAQGPFPAGVTVDCVQRLLLMLAMSGTSRKMNPPGIFQFTDTGGGNHGVQWKSIMGAFGRVDVTQRAWARRNADITRRLLIANGKLHTRWAINHGIKPEYRTIGFDFAEYCKDPPLDSTELKVLSIAKHTATNTGDDEELMNAPLSTTPDVRPNVNAHLHLGGPGGSGPVATSRRLT